MIHRTGQSGRSDIGCVYFCVIGWAAMSDQTFSTSSNIPPVTRRLSRLVRMASRAVAATCSSRAWMRVNQTTRWARVRFFKPNDSRYSTDSY